MDTLPTGWLFVSSLNLVADWLLSGIAMNEVGICGAMPSFVAHRSDFLWQFCRRAISRFKAFCNWVSTLDLHVLHDISSDKTIISTYLTYIVTTWSHYMISSINTSPEENISGFRIEVYQVDYRDSSEQALRAIELPSPLDLKMRPGR